jgi:hypothetical protein
MVNIYTMSGNFVNIELENESMSEKENSEKFHIFVDYHETLNIISYSLVSLKSPDMSCLLLLPEPRMSAA